MISVTRALTVTHDRAAGALLHSRIHTLLPLRNQLADLLSFPDSHFIGSRPAYFQGMVNRAKRGELRLDRALYGMRSRGVTRAEDPAQHAGTVAIAMRGLDNYQPPMSAGAIARRLANRLPR